MQADSTPQLLLGGVLSGLDVVLSGVSDEVSSALAALGADLRALDADLLDEEAVAEAVTAIDLATVLICDAGSLMRASDSGVTHAGAVADSPAGLRDAVAGTWNATRAIVNSHLAPGGFGKVLVIAPRPRDGREASAAAAALENLARTTSVEWARLGIRVVVVRPSDVTSEAALAQVVAYLASPAGDYFSGTVLELGRAGLSGL
jgi:NAD(P)-dependent dehydrogenase (short-subunit alcohol dehydrogenase family)